MNEFSQPDRKVNWYDERWMCMRKGIEIEIKQGYRDSCMKCKIDVIRMYMETHSFEQRISSMA